MLVGAHSSSRSLGADSRGQIGGVFNPVVCRRVFRASLVRNQADGALSSAAVLRVGLGPTTPPLCRYAKCTVVLILRPWWTVKRFNRNHSSSQLWRLAWTAQWHKGGVGGHKPPRRTAAEPSTPSARAGTAQEISPDTSAANYPKCRGLDLPSSPVEVPSRPNAPAQQYSDL